MGHGSSCFYINGEAEIWTGTQITLTDRGLCTADNPTGWSQIKHKTEV